MTGTDKLILVPPENLALDIGGTVYRLSAAIEIDVSDSAAWDSVNPDYTLTGNRAGKDFYVYACIPSSGTTHPLVREFDLSDRLHGRR